MAPIYTPFYFGGIKDKEIETVYLLDILDKYKRIHQSKGLTPIRWGHRTTRKGYYHSDFYEE